MSKGPQDMENNCVTIDKSFIADTAREAVRQFFRPITAPLKQTRGLEERISSRIDDLSAVESTKEQRSKQ